MAQKPLFGKRLREARDLRELSQSELADRARIPVAMISHFETGVRGSASADNLVKLANALEVSIDFLLGRADDPTPRDGPVQASLLRTLGNKSLAEIEAVTRIAEAMTNKSADRNKAK